MAENLQDAAVCAWKGTQSLAPETVGAQQPVKELSRPFQKQLLATHRCPTCVAWRKGNIVPCSDHAAIFPQEAANNSYGHLWEKKQSVEA